MKRAALALTAALLATACATDRVTLLENEDGNATGALAVLASDGQESVIDRPLTEAKLRDGPTKARAVKALKPAYASLLANLPPAAKPFVITFPTDVSAIPADQRGILEARVVTVHEEHHFLAARKRESSRDIGLQLLLRLFIRLHHRARTSYAVRKYGDLVRDGWKAT